MKLFNYLAAGALGFAVSVSAASAATFDAFSNINDGTFSSDPDAHTSGHTHSLWFGSSPLGALGSHSNHFLFEWGDAGRGTFQQNGTSIGDTATLTGQVVNAAGQGFDLALHMVVAGDPGTYKNPYGEDTDLWTFYDLDASITSTLTALGGSGLGNFDISLRGSPLLGQFGLGANDKDAGILGFSSWITLTSTDYVCVTAAPPCVYHGDINIRLEAVPLPAGLVLLPGALFLLGATRARRKS